MTGVRARRRPRLMARVGLSGLLEALVTALVTGLVTGLVTALLTGVLPGVPALTPAASAGQPTSASAVAVARQHRGGPLTGTVMIGDSTTWHVAPVLRHLERDWLIDGRPGRSVRALPARIEHDLRRVPRPANLVMALGTNRSDHPIWTEARLRHAIDLLPRRTHVFLVLVVRAGRVQHHKDVVLQRYNSYSRDLARTRPHTSLVDWRRAVLADPTLDPVTGRSSLLADGTHQTGGPRGTRRGPGVDTYLRLILRAWGRVNHVRPPLPHGD